MNPDDQPSEEAWSLDQQSVMLHEWYESLQKAGFSEEQAFRIILAAVEGQHGRP